MTHIFSYFPGLLLGLVTGLFYFGGLWLTVKRVPFCKKPNQLLVLSAAVRLVPTLAVMFVLIRKDPGMFVAMLMAFFTVRFIMTNTITYRKDSTIMDVKNSSE